MPAHTGIPGNENADQAAKRGLQLDRIHTTVNTGIFREQTRMKEQMALHYKDASQQTKDHRQLHHTDSSMRKLMSMPRNPRHFPVMVFWQELVTARLTEHEAFLDDRETTIAILNSQNAVAYEEITVLL